MLLRNRRWGCAFTAIFTVLGFVFVGWLNKSVASASGPVVVEIFTSEGCSSCPPADILFSRSLSENPNIAGMSEHVDYWDYLGWKDPNSAANFSERQRAYATKLGLTSVYTPQIIVNGLFQDVGNRPASLQKMLDLGFANRPALLSMSCETRGRDQLVVRLNIAGGYKAGSSAHVSITEDEIVSPVASGENAGRQLKHDAVVRYFFSSNLDGKTEVLAKLRLQHNWKRQKLKILGFIQEPGPGRIISSSQSRIR